MLAAVELSAQFERLVSQTLGALIFSFFPGDHGQAVEVGGDRRVVLRGQAAVETERRGE